MIRGEPHEDNPPAFRIGDAPTEPPSVRPQRGKAVTFAGATGADRMERLWSLAGATNGNPWPLRGWSLCAAQRRQTIKTASRSPSTRERSRSICGLQNVKSCELKPADEMWWDPLGASVLEHAGRSRPGARGGPDADRRRVGRASQADHAQDARAGQRRCTPRPAQPGEPAVGARVA